MIVSNGQKVKYKYEILKGKLAKDLQEYTLKMTQHCSEKLKKTYINEELHLVHE